MKKFGTLILWTCLSHFFILFGFAHAGSIIGVIEILWFPYVANDQFSLSLSESVEGYLPVVGFFGFIGNMLLLAAVLMKNKLIRLICHLTGLLSFWISIFYLSSSANVQFSFVFCIPFLIMTLLPFIQRYFVHLNGWIKN